MTAELQRHTLGSTQVFMSDTLDVEVWQFTTRQPQVCPKNIVEILTL